MRRRAEGASWRSLRDYLAQGGLDYTVSGVAWLLKSRQLVGEATFGDELFEVPATINRPTWRRAQQATGVGGRKGKSDRLLARLGVLRCATCGSRMVVSTSNRWGWWTYRCPPKAAARAGSRSPRRWPSRS